MSVLISSLVVILAIFMICKIFAKLTTSFNKSNTCLVGKTAIVTGGNQGIGYQVVLGLASKGCRVIIADKDDSEKSRAAIIKETGNPNIVSKKFDLASLDSVRMFVNDIVKTEKRLDILVNNAGCCLFTTDVTPDGMNKMMQINHFGSFLLTHLLVGLLKITSNSRIVFTSSIAAFCHSFDDGNINKPANLDNTFMQTFVTYSNSKMCGILASNYFADLLKPHGITSNSLYPGIVSTNLMPAGVKDIKKVSVLNYACTFLVEITNFLFSKNQLEGAQTTLYLATSKEVKNVTGKYFIDCTKFIQPRLTWNKDFCKYFIEESIKLVKLTEQEIKI